MGDLLLKEPWVRPGIRFSTLSFGKGSSMVILAPTVHARREDDAQHILLLVEDKTASTIW